MALFIGCFTLLNLAGDWLSPGFDANEWWIDLRPLPETFQHLTLALAATFLLGFAVAPPMRTWRMHVTRLVLGFLLACTLLNCMSFGLLLYHGSIRAGFPIPLSLGIGLSILLILLQTDRKEPAALGSRGKVIVVGTAAIGLFVFPLLQMLCYGKTDYRRKADLIVVFGARVFSDGELSDAADERVTEAVQVFKDGLAPSILMSGGPGDGSIYEAEAMRDEAVRLGVPADAITLDRKGLNTEATVRNVAALCRNWDECRVIAVSHFYHLPRVKMAFQRAGIEAYTVPVHSPKILLGLPLFMIREVAALWVYYVRPLATAARIALSRHATQTASGASLTLWAWNGPDDLTFLSPGKIAVAFLAGTVEITTRTVVGKPRRRELRVNPGTPLIAAVRIETPRSRGSVLPMEQAARASEQILRLADFPTVEEVQLDFDARQSERTFYRQLLVDLRRQLPSTKRLSITALTSWCLGDSWLADLPIDRAVPMLYRMGQGDDKLRGKLAAGVRFGPYICRNDVGVSTDEPWPRPLAAARLWIFNPNPWTPEKVQEVSQAFESL